MSMRIEHGVVEVPTAVHVAALTEDRASLLLCRGRADASCRRPDFVRARQTGVVAVEPADRRVGAAEPVARKPAADTELDRVVGASPSASGNSPPPVRGAAEAGMMDVAPSPGLPRR